MWYLDHAATTPLRPEALAAAEPYLASGFGNPSGMHGWARRAKNAVEAAREQAADILGASHPLEIIFTGGGTEADNLAIAGVALAGDRPGNVVVSAVEHKAVLETAAFVARLGADVDTVAVETDGRIEPDRVAGAVRSDTRLVSVMLANNEVGTIQPVRDIVDAVRRSNDRVLVHTDAVQGFLSEPVTVQATGADLIALASHKFGGPKGVGLLYARSGVTLEPVIHGGGQELGRRSGTHNVAGIVAMVAAMQAAADDREAFRLRIGTARDRFEAVMLDKLPEVVVTAHDAPRLVQHSHLRFPGRRSDSLLIRLDQAGVAAGAGAACQSGAIEPSHVLAAMGFTAVEASECVRFTFGWPQQAADGEAAAVAVIEAVGGRR